MPSRNFDRQIDKYFVCVCVCARARARVCVCERREANPEVVNTTCNSFCIFFSPRLLSSSSSSSSSSFFFVFVLLLSSSYSFSLMVQTAGCQLYRYWSYTRPVRSTCSEGEICKRRMHKRGAKIVVVIIICVWVVMVFIFSRPAWFPWGTQRLWAGCWGSREASTRSRGCCSACRGTAPAACHAG